MGHPSVRGRSILLASLLPLAAASCSSPGAAPAAVAATPSAVPRASHAPTATPTPTPTAAPLPSSTPTVAATTETPPGPSDTTMLKTSWCPNGTAPAPPPAAGELSYVLADKPGSKGFGVGCPQGVLCDEKFDYRALTYKDGNASVYLSFDASATNATNLATLRRAFHYANVVLAFPERAPPGYRGGTFQNMTPSCNIELRELAGGHLRGVVWGTVGLITFEKQNDPRCGVRDRSQPIECSRPERLDKPFRIEFDLTFPTGPKDCRGGGGGDCG